jgi:hypothetical protein
MSALGQKQTLTRFLHMSLYPSKRTSAKRVGMSAKCHKQTSHWLPDCEIVEVHQWLEFAPAI